MTLFDEVDSLGDRPIFYNESYFDYIQGSGRPAMIRVRNLLESWFVEYPDERKEQLRKRLRGEKRNGQKHKIGLRRSNFYEAFFELYIYILLRRLGCKVGVEPEIAHIQGRGACPDFLATHEATGCSFYVEATVQTSAKAQNYDNFVNEVKDTLDRIQSPDFVICIDRLRITSKQWTPSTRRLARYIERCLSDLSWRSRPRLLTSSTFQGHGWKLSFHFESRSQNESWVRPDRSFKETPFTRTVHDVKNIRKAIEDKASHYGQLDHPFIIAINVREYSVGPDVVFEALYGSVSHVFNVVPREHRVIGELEFSHYEPKYDGAFRARGRQHTRVSSVWIASSLFGPSSIGSANICQFDNCYAETVFRPDFPCFPAYYINHEGQLALRSGLTSQQLLGIERHWPEDSPWPTIDFSSGNHLD